MIIASRYAVKHEMCLGYPGTFRFQIIPPRDEVISLYGGGKHWLKCNISTTCVWTWPFFNLAHKNIEARKAPALLKLLKLNADFPVAYFRNGMQFISTPEPGSHRKWSLPCLVPQEPHLNEMLWLHKVFQVLGVKLDLLTTCHGKTGIAFKQSQQTDREAIILLRFNGW